MGIVIAVIVVVVVLVAVGLFVLVRRRRGAAAAPEPAAEPPKPARPEPAPMTDLEAALSQVTDRAGRPIREKIDAEAGHVDELRIPDDTGPLLRRALDSVLPHDDAEDDESENDEPQPPA